MKEFVALISVPAECEDDFEELVECMQKEVAFVVEWWKQVKAN